MCIQTMPGALPKASGLIEMGVARLVTTSAAPIHHGQVVKAALVIGSGLSALTVALNLADEDLHVILLEESSILGGRFPACRNAPVCCSPRRATWCSGIR